jgi:dipeptidyl aminopeptidase/acylaminoacyl peptidase
MLSSGVGISLTASLQGTELPVETFFRNYEYNEAMLSPDGEFLGVLAPDANRVGLSIFDLRNKTARWAFADRLADVDSFFWLTTNRLAFRLSHDGYAESGLMAVDRDGKRAVRLIGAKGAMANVGRRLAVDWGTHFLSFLPGSTDEFLVTSLEKSHAADSATLLRFADVYRMNFFTGQTSLEVKNPGHVISWVVDDRGVVRAGVALYLTRFQVLYRDSAGVPWEKIADYNYEEDGILPVAVAADNRTLLVASHGGEDHQAIYTFDPKTRKIVDLAFRHADVDVQDEIRSRNNHLVGVLCQADRPEVYWFESNRVRWQQAVDKVLTNTVNRLVSASADGAKVVFVAVSDRSPGTYYLFDTKAMRLEKLFEVAEWIHLEEMADMRPIKFQARDGLTLHGYLTLPPGTSGKNLPLIVNPHGGPRARDVWGFDPEVQFLANRGYAVLRVNFRGSTGYGLSFLKAGNLEWGMKQQDDITDGVKWAIDQGIADSKRVCIYGASYGGFAALRGLESTPELYRCGISYAGVIDIEATLKTHLDWTMRNPVPRLRIAEAGLMEMLGEKKEQKEHWKDISPLSHVDQIQVPVLLAYSEYDPRVPISTARSLAKELKKSGKLYDFMVKDNEAHGFHQEANKIALWKKVDEFSKPPCGESEPGKRSSPASDRTAFREAALPPASCCRFQSPSS